MQVAAVSPQNTTKDLGIEFAPDRSSLHDCVINGDCTSLTMSDQGVWIVLAWVVGALLVGLIARTQDHSAGAWFVLSIIASPLVAGMFLLARGKGRTTCPHCQDLMDVDEVYCRTCGQRRPPEVIYDE